MMLDKVLVNKALCFIPALLLKKQILQKPRPDAFIPYPKPRLGGGQRSDAKLPLMRSGTGRRVKKPPFPWRTAQTGEWRAALGHSSFAVASGGAIQ